MGLFSSKKSVSTNQNQTYNTDNRMVAAEGSIQVGAGGTFYGTDAGALQMGLKNADTVRDIAAVNARALAGVSEAQARGAAVNAETLTNIGRQNSDTMRFLTQAGAGMFEAMGDDLQGAMAAAGSNNLQAWSHTVDAGENLLGQMVKAQQANTDASRVIAQTAMTANQNSGATAESMIRYIAIAAAVIGAALVFKGGK